MIDRKVFLVLFKRFKSFIPDYEAKQTIFLRPNVNLFSFNFSVADHKNPYVSL